MAKTVLTNCYVSVAGTEVSNRVRSVAINYEADAVEDTCMGAGTHTFLPSLKNYTVDITFANDWADDDLDEDMFAAVGTAVAVAIRPVNTTKGATNPEYNATMVLTSWGSVSGSVGALAEVSAKFVPGGESPTLLRSTS